MAKQFDELRATMSVKSRRRAKVLYRQEALILDVTESIWKLLKKRKMNKVMLAKKLGCTQPHVTKLLNGGRNMTLRTLANIVGALDGEVTIKLKPAAPENDDEQS